MKTIRYEMVYMLALLFQTALVYADCMGPYEKEIKTKFLSCQKINPEKNTVLLKNMIISRGSLKSELLKRYKGVELNTDYGKLFVPEYTGLDCENIKLEETYNVKIAFACCDGDPNPPCYLGYSEYIKEIRK